MTLSKTEQRKKTIKKMRLYFETHSNILIDKKLLKLINLTKKFFKYKSNNVTINEFVRAFIDNEIPFNCTPLQQEMYKAYLKKHMQQSRKAEKK